MPVTKLEKLLQDGAAGGLRELIRTARDMDSLTEAIRRAAPCDLGENIVAANLRTDGELVIICSSSAWASRARFEADALIGAAQEAGFGAAAIRVSVTRS